MSTALILIGIIASTLTPTIAIVVSRILNRRELRAIKDQADDSHEQVKGLRVETSLQLDQIHLLVNSRLSDALERIKHLEEALGIEPDGDVPKTEHNGH